MKTRALFILSSFIMAIGFVGCAPTPSQLKKVVEENPEIVLNAIEKHPDKFLETLNNAARKAQEMQRQKQAESEEQRFEEEFKNPKKPEIDKARAMFGPDNAPITIVEYSDFECPYCSRGYETIKQVMSEYGDKVRVLYKHLPLDFHPMAMPAAQYYEAIALQSAAKAKKFHDHIFENQKSLSSGKEKFLKDAAKKVGANLAQVMKDIDSDKVKKRIEADMAEARKFEFSGTPGFLVNGVSLKGAYPFPEFKKVIDRHLKENNQG